MYVTDLISIKSIKSVNIEPIVNISKNHEHLQTCYCHGKANI